MSQAVHGRVQDDVDETTEVDVVDEASRCEECGGRVRPVGIEYVCEGCGLVEGEDALDRSFNRPRRELEPDTRTRPSVTHRLHDRGLGSEIWRCDEARSGISPGTREWLKRCRAFRHLDTARSKPDRNKRHGLTCISRLAASVDAGSTTRETASQLFHTATDENLLIGRSVETIAGACVKAALRIHGQPFKYSAGGMPLRVPMSSVENAYRVLNRELELPLPPPTPREYVPGIASELDTPAYAERRAREYAGILHEHAIGRNPSGLAAACVYYATPGVTQIQAAEAAGVSEVTIRAGRDLLEDVLDENGGELDG